MAMFSESRAEFTVRDATYNASDRLGDGDDIYLVQQDEHDAIARRGIQSRPDAPGSG